MEEAHRMQEEGMSQNKGSPISIKKGHFPRVQHPPDV